MQVSELALWLKRYGERRGHVKEREQVISRDGEQDEDAPMIEMYDSLNPLELGYID